MGRDPLIVHTPTTLHMVYLGTWARLTRPQQHFLDGANDCTPPNARAVRFGWSGMGARGASIRVARRLEQRGLVEYVDHGRIEDDGNGDTEHPIYAITQKGRDVLYVVAQHKGASK